ncbi:MAG: type II toxin-antitoxin system HicB family antitoxin [Candidatus Sungbacteria bacterium]|nr:type II toxin-antitoxin system HicB family antitoxin [Candidatus Sungbacteria bacterium]
MAGYKKQFIIRTKHGSYRARIWRDKTDHAYLADAPDFPEVATFGISLTDAKRMIKDAIELHCDCLIDQKKVVVDHTGKAVGRIPRSRILIPA